jgi:Ino eighty subunit 2
VGGRQKDETSRNKKENEAENALRREETACKQSTSMRKKLEDEKVRIYSRHNHHAPFPDTRASLHARKRRSTASCRLLKKKFSARNRRNPLASAEDRTPASHTSYGPPAEGEVGEEENVEARRQEQRRKYSNS